MSEVIAGAWQSAVKLAFGLGVVAFAGGLLWPAPSLGPASTVKPAAPFDRLAGMVVESQVFERGSDKARLRISLRGFPQKDGGLAVECQTRRRFKTGDEDRSRVLALAPKGLRLLEASRTRSSGVGHSATVFRGESLGLEAATSHDGRRHHEPGAMLPEQVLLALRLGAFGDSAASLRVVTDPAKPSRLATLTPTGESLRTDPSGASGAATVKAREWTLSADGATLWTVSLELGGERRCLRMVDPSGAWTLIKSSWDTLR